MSKVVLKALAPVLLLLAGLCGPAFAGNAPAAPADPRVDIAKKLGAKPEDLRPSPVPGIYEFTQGAEIGYVTSDGRYFFGGDLFEIESRRNLSDVHRNDARVRLIAAVPESEMIVFSPQATRYTVTVFTDIDCGYCRKLHSEIKQLNDLGVRVRYMFYPRSGPGSPSWHEAEAVWCSKDRNDALTRAKKGEEVKAKNCSTPVKRQYELGEELGIRGTPGIFTQNGTYLAGYLPPAKLVDAIKKSP
ncbi:MAG TPA: DsbC family protein [Steroidobacteraceae bacterium]|nr:DsbC family protein [Steroidobacteraceae bacterium]